MNRFLNWRAGRWLAICALLWATPAPALEIVGYDPARHDRFADFGASNFTLNPGFIGASYDLSGIGWNGSKGVALISDQYFIAANHFQPSGSVAFQGSDGVVRTYVIDSYTTTATGPYTSDLVIGKLTTAVDSHITSYAIGDGTSADFIGREILTFGQNQQAGRNVISGIEYVSTSPDNPTLTFYFNYDPATGFNPDEARAVGGDSGSPTFTVIDGQLVLLGDHFANDPDNPLLPTYDSLAAAYFDQYPSGSGARILILPEPASLGVFGLFLLGLQRRRRTRVAV